MLEQIGNSGLYPMHSVFSFTPRDVLPENLDLEAVFDDATDELVRLLLQYSYEQNSWVGVSWPALVKKLEENLSRYQELLDEYRPKLKAYDQSILKYTQRNRWSFGLYRFIQPTPLPPAHLEMRRLAKHLPWMYQNQMERLKLSAAELRAQTYLRIETDSETDVFFLTHSLLLKYVSGKKA